MFFIFFKLFLCNENFVVFITKRGQEPSFVVHPKPTPLTLRITLLYYWGSVGYPKTIKT